MTQKIEEYPVIKQGLVKMTKRNNGFSLRVPTGEARRLIFGLSEDIIKKMIQEKETAWGRKPGFMPVMKSDVERDSGAKYVRTFYRNSYRYDIYKFPLVA